MVRARLKPGVAEWRRRHRRGKGRFGYVRDQVLRKGRHAWELGRAQYSALVAKPCHYCGLATDVEAGTGLDRLDNSLGYVPGNVVPACSVCNMVRGDRFTPAEMRIIGAAIRQIRAARPTVSGNFSRQQRRQAEREVASYLEKQR